MTVQRASFWSTLTPLCLSKCNRGHSIVQNGQKQRSFKKWCKVLERLVFLWIAPQTSRPFWNESQTSWKVRGTLFLKNLWRKTSTHKHFTKETQKWLSKISWAADLNVLALSDISLAGSPWRLEKRRNDSTVFTSSRCTALVEVHVNRHT